MTIYPQARLTQLPIQDIDFPSSFAADFVSEFVKACELDHSGSEIYHSWKVCIMACRIGKKLGIGKNEMKELFFASLLHDIGGVMVGGHVIDLLTQMSWSEGMLSIF